MSYQLPKLSYSYDALEPHVDTRTMEIHHSKHHAAYINNLNAILAEYNCTNPGSIEEFVINVKYSGLPESVREKIRFNAGGHYNHSLFWQIISPSHDSGPQGNLLDALLKNFESFENFQSIFENSAMSHLGSGWTWLCVEKTNKNSLFICSTFNHDVPNMIGYSARLGIPILTLDLWEHAYYLKFQNRKGEYIKTFWDIINWNKVEEYYNSAITK